MDGDEPPVEDPSGEEPMRPWQGAVRAAGLAAGAVQPNRPPIEVEPMPVQAAPAVPAAFEPRPTAPDPIASLRRTWLVRATLALLATYLLSPLVPLWAGGLGRRVEIYAATVLFFALVTWIILELAPLRALPGKLLAAATAVLATLVMAGNLSGIPVATDMLKIVFAVAAGFAILVLIERPWWLIPVSVFVPISDAWSVYSSRGVTNQIIEQSDQDPRWLEWPTLLVPTFATPIELSSRLGIVDIFFCAVYIGAAARWSIRPWVVAAALCASLVLTTVLAVELPGGGVPALPLLCIAFLLVSYRPLIADLRAELGR